MEGHGKGNIEEGVRDTKGGKMTYVETHEVKGGGDVWVKGCGGNVEDWDGDQWKERGGREG